MFDLTNLRREFGRYLDTHTHVRWGLDAALMHVCTLAFNAGMKEQQAPALEALRGACVKACKDLGSTWYDRTHHGEGGGHDECAEAIQAIPIDAFIAGSGGIDDSIASLIHYPECWDTAAYPTLIDAIREALSWQGCSVCKSATGAPRG